MGEPARFKIVEETEKSLLIRDLGPWSKCLTVTNDAERVVARLYPILNGRRLFYFDSEGELGELKISGGRFADFARVEQVP
jgi:hypothetical protein